MNYAVANLVCPIAFSRGPRTWLKNPQVMVRPDYGGGIENILISTGAACNVARHRGQTPDRRYRQ